jgi:hypothetical protein
MPAKEEIVKEMNEISTYTDSDRDTHNDIFSVGELVRVLYSYEHEELEDSVGLIVCETEMVFDTEDSESIGNVFDVQVNDILLQCLEDDLLKIINE